MTVAVDRQRFAAIVGDDRAIDSPETLRAYASDMTEAPPSLPGLVVKVRNAAEVQAVLRAAAETGVAVTPAVARMNVGGLTIPAQGGIVVDLTGMDRIVSLDRDNMYAVVEPGVTFAQLSDALDGKAPELTVSYPLSPPHTSVLANWLLDGLGSLSLGHGSHGEHIGGLEAVLPDGTLIKTGACALSPYWFGRGPLPDLTGLFVNWQGATGIVTKCAIQLWRRPKLSRRLFAFVADLAGTFSLVRDLVHAEVCRDLAAITWPAGKMVFGVQDPAALAAGEPEIFVYVEIGANDERGLRYKEGTVRRIIADHGKQGLPVVGVVSIDELIRVAPTLGRFAEFPMSLDFLLDHPGGGLTWVGTYGPVSKWEQGAERCTNSMKRHGIAPFLVTRPMKGGHFGVLRMISCFDRSDPAQVERVRMLNRELLTECLELGFVPYKAPDWAVRELSRRIDPGFASLFQRVREAIDPNRIMNPDRWPL